MDPVRSTYCRTEISIRVKNIEFWVCSVDIYYDQKTTKIISPNGCLCFGRLVLFLYLYIHIYIYCPLIECTYTSGFSGLQTTDVRPLNTFDHHIKSNSDFRTFTPTPRLPHSGGDSDFRNLGPRGYRFVFSSTYRVQFLSLV